MKFRVTEVKQIGRGMIFSLSLRLEKKDDPNVAQCVGGRQSSLYTIHAVVPYDTEFGNVRIGQTFEFKEVLEKLNR